MSKPDAADAVFNPAKTEARDFVKRTVDGQSSSSLTIAHTNWADATNPHPLTSTRFVASELSGVFVTRLSTRKTVE